MKVVYAAVFKETSTNFSQGNALERQGADLVRYEISEGYGDLLEACRRERPDLLLLSKCQGMPNEILWELSQEGVKSFLWFMDPLATLRSLLDVEERIFLCDRSFFTIWETYEHARGLRPDNCFFLREGFDADIDYPRDVPVERDAVFIGNLRKGRFHYRQAVDFEIVNDAYCGRHAEVVSGSRVNLNFTEGGASDRVYKVMAAGGFLLTERWPMMERDFIVGADLDVFSGPDELRAKIAYYLEHEDERRAIADSGRRAVQRFSRDAWAAEILEAAR